MARLHRTLGLRDLTLLTVGTVIGSGIFIVPSSVINRVDGAVAPALMAWLVGGILSLLGALTYGELSANKPEAGGLYVYLRDCFGPFPAFLYGWTLFFVIGSGSLATLAVAFSSYLSQIVPISGWQAKVVSVVMIVIVAAINVRGTRHSANVQNWTTAIKVSAILLIGGLLLLLGRELGTTAGQLWPQRAGIGSTASGFGVAMIGVLWAYEGWQFSTFSAGETVDAQRNMPRAFLIGSITLIFIYMLANVAYLAALGPAGIAQTDRVAATAVSVVAGPGAAKLISVAVLISIFSAANGMTLSSPRVYYAMAADGLFFKRLAEVHPRFHTPAIAIIVSSACAIVFALSSRFEQLLNYVIFAGWIFYGLAAASIFVYRQRNPTAELAYRVPGYPFTPLVFIVSAAALVLNTLVSTPREAGVGLAIVVAGTPAYLVWRSRQRRSKEKRQHDG